MVNSDIIEYQNYWENLQKSWNKHHSKLYHISPVYNRDKILTEGLIPNSMSGPVIFYSDRVFLLTNSERIFEIQELTGKHNCFVDLWEIDNSDFNIELYLDDIAKDQRCCYATELIPSNKLKLVKTIDPLVI
jgi:hypothetical protein